MNETEIELEGQIDGGSKVPLTQVPLTNESNQPLNLG